jgi:hypothetical protein
MTDTTVRPIDVSSLSTLQTSFELKYCVLEYPVAVYKVGTIVVPARVQA